MHKRMWGIVALAAAVACAPGHERSDRFLLEQGRLYTTWLYGSEYEKLWDRFSPDMRQSFGSVTDLASFAGRAVGRLGQERGAVDERIEAAAPLRIYSRSAAFDRASQRVRIEWSLEEDGEVTGLLLRPDTEAQ
ncbi:MAG TPA: hypothetical protein VMN37_11985 [Gemmatimonadales bacterium]|nr:hypothetical protein [Gemmatimonadales bacterium]